MALFLPRLGHRLREGGDGAQAASVDVFFPLPSARRSAHSGAYAPIGCDTQRAFMKWSRTSYDSKKEHSRTGENEKGIQNPQV